MAAIVAAGRGGHAETEIMEGRLFSLLECKILCLVLGPGPPQPGRWDNIHIKREREASVQSRDVSLPSHRGHYLHVNSGPARGAGQEQCVFTAWVLGAPRHF